MSPPAVFTRGAIRWLVTSTCRSTGRPSTWRCTSRRSFTTSAATTSTRSAPSCGTGAAASSSGSSRPTRAATGVRCGAVAPGARGLQGAGPAVLRIAGVQRHPGLSVRRRAGGGRLEAERGLAPADDPVAGGSRRSRSIRGGGAWPEPAGLLKTVRASPFHLARVRRGAVEQLLVVQRQRGQPEQRVERETGGWRGHPLFSLENLYRAYRRRRRRKHQRQ